MKTLFFLLLLVSQAQLAQAQVEGVATPPIADATITTAATLVIAGNAFRSALSCTNHSTTINVRWGDANITTTKGQRIPTGATIEIRNRGPIYMIAESSTATVSCTEETK